MKYAWLTQWTTRRPTLSSDEHWRHTLVLPRPWATGHDVDDEPIYPALVLVIRPWWACRDVRDRDHRNYVRWDRDRMTAIYALPDGIPDDAEERAWDAIDAAFEHTRPRTPAAWDYPEEKKS